MGGWDGFDLLENAPHVIELLRMKFDDFVRRLFEFVLSITCFVKLLLHYF